VAKPEGNEGGSTFPAVVFHGSKRSFDKLRMTIFWPPLRSRHPRRSSTFDPLLSFPCLMTRPHLLAAAAFLLAQLSSASAADPELLSLEVIIYGGTPSGVMAAVAAARNGHTVALIDINNHLGGVVSGGLTSSDMGDVKTIGGLAADFFERVRKHYRETYGADSKQFAACHDGAKFEPHVAEAIYDKMVAEQRGIRVFKKHRFNAVALDGGTIASLTVDDLAAGKPRTFTGGVFIDASYEGDLMAGAGVPYRVGREARAEFGEYLAGINDGPKAVRGLGDHRTMSYNYRVSITSNPENRVLAEKPANYTPEPFARGEGMAIKSGRVTKFLELYSGREKSAGPNDKFDSNWCDFIGNSEGYAEGDWTTRAGIEARQHDYVMSRLYYLQNDPELPAAFRADAQNWGLPKDEFADNGHFPFQLYVREARRMIGRYILHENDLTQDRSKPDAICAGSYGIDCHMVRQILSEGKLVTEHTRHVSVDNYDIPYACLTPFEPANLLVPVCLSATHVAYCSLRMEPVYMMLGEAAGEAAHLAIAHQVSVQKVDVPELRSLLQKQGGIVDAGYQTPVKITFTPDRPNVGDVVKFSAEVGAAKAAVTQYWWDFSGNGTVSAEGTRAEVKFPLEKVYSVSLIVEDKSGRRRMVTAGVPVGSATNRDLTVDEFDADLFGRWQGAYPEIIRPDHSRTPDVFTGPGTNYDMVRDGKHAPARARFQPVIPRAGRYELCLGFRSARGQASNVPVTIRSADGVKKLKVDQRTERTPFPWFALGEFRFKAGDSGFVEITNGNVDGRVAVDGVRWVWLGE
jgi:hypothetical protein